MEEEFLGLVTAIVVIVATVWLLNNWIKSRGGQGASVQPDGLETSRQIELLSNENAGLKGQIVRLEERIAVLERIATDPAERTAREIDSLR